MLTPSPRTSAEAARGDAPRRLVIAHILSSFDSGGQERVALDLASEHHRGGFDTVAVSLAGEPDGPMAARFLAAGARIHRLAKRPGFDPLLPLRLARLLAREGVTLVHTHNPLALVYGAPAGRLAGAAVVHTKHGRNPGGGRRLALRRLAARLVHSFVAVSDVTAAQAREQRDCPPDRLLIIPNGIDADRFVGDPRARAEVRRELGIPDSAWVIGTVGRIDPAKDHAMLLRAAEPLLDEENRLIIAGDGPLLPAIAGAAAASEAARHIHLLGWRDDVPRLLAAFDVFALSSITEGLPLVVPEAMATGLPVVATAVGGLPGVVEDGATGFLVPAGDPVTLRMRLAALARDRARAAAMGRSGRTRALLQYSAERMARDYLRVYEQASGQRRSPMPALERT